MPVSFIERANGVLLTTSDLTAWRDEIQSLAAESERINQKIEAAEHLLELTQPKAALQGPAVSPAAQDMPLTDAIMRIVERERRPMSLPDLRAQLNRDPFQAQRLKSNPNYYHTALKRLRDRGQIIRDGDAYRLPQKENEASNANTKDASETALAAQ